VVARREWVSASDSWSECQAPGTDTDGPNPVVKRNAERDSEASESNLIGLRDRALIAITVYSFARDSTVAGHLKALL
jgi:hypothetical protein